MRGRLSDVSLYAEIEKKMQFRKFRNIFHTVSTIYFTFVCIVSFLCCLLKKDFYGQIGILYRVGTQKIFPFSAHLV